MPTVAGIDGWREGWMLAIADGPTPKLTLRSCASISDALAETSRCDAVAIDMPIALVERGRREAEVELRSGLGSSARSVFTSPTRKALSATDRKAADAINRRNGGPGISAQTWGLAASIREVRAALADHPAGGRWWETHPESSFAEMNGGVALPGKRTALGVARRLELLRVCHRELDAALLQSPERVPIDDVLDAIACVWTARRIVDESARLVGPPGRDDEGFPLGIRL